MTRRFKTSYSAFYMLTIHTTRVYTLTKFYQNLFKCYHYRQKTCLPVLAKTTSLSEIKIMLSFQALLSLQSVSLCYLCEGHTVLLDINPFKIPS